MPAEKTQPFCPCSRVLNWTGKGLNVILSILCWWGYFYWYVEKFSFSYYRHFSIFYTSTYFSNRIKLPSLFLSLSQIPHSRGTDLYYYWKGEIHETNPYPGYYMNLTTTQFADLSWVCLAYTDLSELEKSYGSTAQMQKWPSTWETAPYVIYFCKDFNNSLGGETWIHCAMHILSTEVYWTKSEMKTALFQKISIQPLTLHGRKTTSVVMWRHEKTKCHQKSSTKNMQRNVQTFKSWVFCGSQCALNSSNKG